MNYGAESRFLKESLNKFNLDDGTYIRFKKIGKGDDKYIFDQIGYNFLL